MADEGPVLDLEDERAVRAPVLGRVRGGVQPPAGPLGHRGGAVEHAGPGQVAVEVTVPGGLGEQQPRRPGLGAEQSDLAVHGFDVVDVLLGGRVVGRFLEGPEGVADVGALGRGAGGVDVGLVVEVGVLKRDLDVVADLVQRLLEQGQVGALTHEGEEGHPGLLHRGGERGPVGLAEEVVGALVDHVHAEALVGLRRPGRLGDEGVQVGVEDAGVGPGVGKLVVQDRRRADGELVQRVGDGLDRSGGDRVVAGAPRLLRGDREAGDVDQPALGAGGGPEVVLHRAGADDPEVLLARLLQHRLVLGHRGVAQVQHDLLAVDPTGGVAPLDEGGAGVEELLVQAGTTLEPRIGHRAHGDAVGRDALGLGGVAADLTAPLVRAAHPGQVAEVTGRHRASGRLGRLVADAAGLVLAPITAAAGSDESEHSEQREQAADGHGSPRVWKQGGHGARWPPAGRGAI